MAVKVNDTRISDEAIEREARSLQERMARQDPERFASGPSELVRLRLREMAQQRLVDSELMRQEAERRAATVDPGRVDEAAREIAEHRFGAWDRLDAESQERARREAESNERLRRLFEEIEASVDTPTEADARGFLDSHPEYFREPEQVRAAHIVAHGKEDDPASMERARSRIAEAQKALENGEDFAEVARRLSDCPDNGGDLGVFPKGRMVPRFESVVFALSPGQISEPFQTEFGWHIARLDETFEPEAPDFETVKPQVLEFLQDRAKHKAFETFVDSLRAQASIDEAPEQQGT